MTDEEPEDLVAENDDITRDLDDDATPEGTDEGDLQVDLRPPGIIIEKNDRSLAEFQRWYKSGRLIVDPEWQRQYVWDRRRASKLIESILIDVPGSVCQVV